MKTKILIPIVLAIVLVLASVFGAYAQGIIERSVTTDVNVERIQGIIAYSDEELTTPFDSLALDVQIDEFGNYAPIPNVPVFIENKSFTAIGEVRINSSEPAIEIDFLNSSDTEILVQEILSNELTFTIVPDNDVFVDGTTTIQTVFGYVEKIESTPIPISTPIIGDVTLTLADGSGLVNEPVAMVLTADVFPEGLSGFIVDIMLPDNSFSVVSAQAPAGLLSVTDNRIALVDLADDITSDSENIILVTIFVQGDTIGESVIEFVVVRLDDDSGNAYENIIAASGMLSIR